MNPYFSGVAGASEFQMLESAGVKRILVDPFDLKNIQRGRVSIAIDSGAYRASKRQLNLDLDNYLNFVRNRGPFDFALALDVIGDARASWRNWERLRGLVVKDDPPIIPVFQWGSNRDDLIRYLGEAPVVGIGG